VEHLEGVAEALGRAEKVAGQVADGPGAAIGRARPVDRLELPEERPRAQVLGSSQPPDLISGDWSDLSNVDLDHGSGLIA